MAMVDVDSSSLQADSQSKSVGFLSEGLRPLGAVLHTLQELRRTLEMTYDCHGDCAINIFRSYYYYYYYYYYYCWDKPSRHEDIRKRDENNELQQASW